MFPTNADLAFPVTATPARRDDGADSVAFLELHSIHPSIIAWSTGRVQKCRENGMLSTGPADRYLPLLNCVEPATLTSFVEYYSIFVGKKIPQ
jgi:hypothetical protein